MDYGLCFMGPSPDADSLNVLMQTTSSDLRPSFSSQRSIASDNVSQNSSLSKKKDRIYPCTVCPKYKTRSFTSPNDLERHLRSVHGVLKDGDRIWMCPVAGCASAGKIWTRFDNCKAHILRHGPYYESHVEFAETTYSSVLHQRSRTVKPIRTVHCSTGVNFDTNQANTAPSNLWMDGSWREVSPAQFSDHTRDHLSFCADSCMTQVGSDSCPEYPKYNDLAAIGDDLNNEYIMESQITGLYPTITLQDVETSEQIPASSSLAWIEAKKLLQETSKSIDQGASTSKVPVMDKCTPRKGSSSKYYGSLPHRSPETLMSFKSEGERSFLGYHTTSTSEQDVILDEDELFVASLLASLVLARYHILNQENRLPTKHAPSQTTNTGEKQNDSASQPHSSHPSSSLGKRSRGKGAGSGSNDDKGENSRRNKGNGGSPDSGPKTKKLKEEHRNRPSFACPYHKANPTQYSSANTAANQYRSCGTCLLRTISAVRQHLHRTHKRPDFHCAFCYQEFSSPEERDIHHRETFGRCGPKEDPFAEKMSYDAYMKIKSTRTSKSKEENEREDYSREAWFKIFQTIFPGSPLPLSPYSDDQVTIWTQVEIFRVLGPVMAEYLYENVNNSISGRHLPQLTQAIFDEAFRIFSAELAQCVGEQNTHNIPPRWQAEITLQTSLATQRPHSAAPLPNDNCLQQMGDEVPKSVRNSSDEGIDVNSTIDDQNRTWPQQALRSLPQAQYFTSPNAQQVQEQQTAQRGMVAAPWHSNFDPHSTQAPWNPLSRDQRH